MSGLTAITGVTSLTNNCLREYMGNARVPPTSTGPGPRQIVKGAGNGQRRSRPDCWRRSRYRATRTSNGTLTRGRTVLTIARTSGCMCSSDVGSVPFDRPLMAANTLQV